MAAVAVLQRPSAPAPGVERPETPGLRQVENLAHQGENSIGLDRLVSQTVMQVGNVLEPYRRAGLPLAVIVLPARSKRLADLRGLVPALLSALTLLRRGTATRAAIANRPTCRRWRGEIVFRPLPGERDHAPPALRDHGRRQARQAGPAGLPLCAVIKIGRLRSVVE